MHSVNYWSSRNLRASQTGYSPLRTLPSAAILSPHVPTRLRINQKIIILRERKAKTMSANAPNSFRNEARIASAESVENTISMPPTLLPQCDASPSTPPVASFHGGELVPEEKRTTEVVTYHLCLGLEDFIRIHTVIVEGCVWKEGVGLVPAARRVGWRTGGVVINLGSFRTMLLGQRRE